MEKSKLKPYQMFFCYTFFATPCQDDDGQPTSPCEMEPVCLTPASDPNPGIELNRIRDSQFGCIYIKGKYLCYI